MKFGKTVLLEIIDVVQDGLLNGSDVSQRLREIDVVESNGVLELTVDYVKDHPRLTDWEEPSSGDLN